MQPSNRSSIEMMIDTGGSAFMRDNPVVMWKNMCKLEELNCRDMK